MKTTTAASCAMLSFQCVRGRCRLTRDQSNRAARFTVGRKARSLYIRCRSRHATYSVAGGARSRHLADCRRGARQDRFLVGGDHLNTYGRSCRTDTGVAAARRGVQCLIERDAGPGELRHGAGAYLRHVLANAAAEHDAVAASEDRKISAEILAQPVAVELDGELRLRRRIRAEVRGI